VNASGLGAATYTGNIVITPVSGSPQAVSITLNVLPSASLAVSPSPLGFIYLQGASIPAPQTLAITSTGPTLGLNVNATTLTGGNWLFIDQSAGITPMNLRVSVNPGGLTPGPYTGAITITPLVAEIVRPEYAPGQLLERLAEQSASYIAFLASFAMPVLFGSIIVRCSKGCATATAACTWPTFSFC